MNSWQLIPAKAFGVDHMKRDISLFNEAEKEFTGSNLYIYTWLRKCISLGYSQNIEDEIKVEEAQKLGFEIVKRPTGGGIVFHDEFEVSYSLITNLNNPILPKGLIPSYKRISEAVVYALNLLGVKAQIQSSKITNLNRSFCFAYPAEYEIVAYGRKIVGSAQKRGRQAFLQQGSIFVSKISDNWFSVLKKPLTYYNAISVEEILKRIPSFNELESVLVKGFENILGVRLQ